MPGERGGRKVAPGDVDPVLVERVTQDSSQDPPRIEVLGDCASTARSSAGALKGYSPNPSREVRNASWQVSWYRQSSRRSGPNAGASRGPSPLLQCLFKSCLAEP